MADVAGLINNLLDKIKSIPEVRLEMDDRLDSIEIWRGRYAVDHPDWFTAVREMPTPGILIAWRGFSLGPNEYGGMCYQHDVAVALRSKLQTAGDTAFGYYALTRAIIEGIPDGSDLQLQLETIHNDFDPMHVANAGWVTDPEGLSYFELSLNFSER